MALKGDFTTFQHVFIELVRTNVHDKTAKIRNPSPSDIIDGESKLIETVGFIFPKCCNFKVEAIVLTVIKIYIILKKILQMMMSLNCLQLSHENEVLFYHEHW